MANKPKKVKDPTEVALSDIQEALHISDASVPGNNRGSVRSEAAPASASASPAYSEPSFGESSFDTRPSNDRPMFEPIEEPHSIRRAANDDRETIGQILQAIQKGRPARNVYTLATLFAGVWILGAIILTISFLPALQATIGQGAGGTLAMAGLAALFAAPVLLIYFLAMLSWRGKELRMIAQSMAQVAIRFSEPESAASDSMVTVGQAIRREVAAMGDGVERAIARAGELETLVANEVSALEHAYNDNEVRIRALLQDLGSQRDTLVGQAAQIRDAINSVHLDLGHDISQINELVAEQVNEASRRITHTLAEKAEHITRALGHAGDTMIQSLGERGGDLLERLEATSRETAQAIAGASDRLASTLNFKTDHIGDEFTEITANLQHMMSVRLERITEGFAQKSAAVLDMMTNRSQEMTDLAIETGNQLAETISG